MDPHLKLWFDFEDDFIGNLQVEDKSGHATHGIIYHTSAEGLPNVVAGATNTRGSRAAEFWLSGVYTDGGAGWYPGTQYFAVTNIAPFGDMPNGTISFWLTKLAKPNDIETQETYGRQTLEYILQTGFQPELAGAGAINSFLVGFTIPPERLCLRSYQTGGGSEGVLLLQFPFIDPGNHSELNIPDWTHFAITWDAAANETKGYKNGSLVATSTMGGLPYLRMQNYLCIGANGHGGTPQWTYPTERFPNDAYHYGKLDDLRIYDRTLNGTEIGAVYAATDFRTSTVAGVTALSGGAVMR